ncbi:MAG TPA: ATP synthase F0 subunit B [Bryobacteraceae bacterium]|jgi:F0F1-type ATP synthase membrane subunit b/b'
MDSTLTALADLLVEAIPTIFFFILLTVYLKYVFFRPMARILEERRKQTEGVRELAQRAFDAADEKTSQFERALQLARVQIHQENEALRRQWSEEQAEAMAKARIEASHHIEEAKHQIAQEVEKAKGELDISVDRLSAQIVESLVRRRAA